MRRSDDKLHKAGSATTLPQASRILLVDVAPAMTRALGLPASVSVVPTRYAALDARLLAQVMPDLILAPLLGPAFDILDLAARLAQLGYRGPLRALTSPLPDPASVAIEIRNHCNGLDFDLVVLPEEVAPIRAVPPPR